MIPRAADPAFHDSITAAFRAAGVAPSFLETAEPLVDRVLLMVLADAGTALLPGSAAGARRVAGVRFRPLAPPAPTTGLGADAPVRLSG